MVLTLHLIYLRLWSQLTSSVTPCSSISSGWWSPISFLHKFLFFPSSQSYLKGTGGGERRSQGYKPNMIFEERVYPMAPWPALICTVVVYWEVILCQALWAMLKRADSGLMSLGFPSRSMWSMWIIAKHFEVVSPLCGAPLCAKRYPGLWWCLLLPLCDPNKLCSYSDLLTTLCGIPCVWLICPFDIQFSTSYFTTLGGGNSWRSKSQLNLTDFIFSV